MSKNFLVTLSLFTSCAFAQTTPSAEIQMHEQPLLPMLSSLCFPSHSVAQCPEGKLHINPVLEFVQDNKDSILKMKYGRMIYSSHLENNPKIMGEFKCGKILESSKKNTLLWDTSSCSGMVRKMYELKLSDEPS